ncbi:DUF5343 domain-containing protein [Gymnodinialimonas ulvae]|uniref:DUF5343 domain-containing protein n=1 Tax=Gymnodinialimonas ulvae TaxID=3126504 RepID=UPI0030B18988
MADGAFPQIPATVWWGIRDLLQRSPSAKYDDSMLAAKLGVQAVAARQYIAELTRVGILDEEGKATELGNRWRLDEKYSDAVDEILSGAYPESLTTIASAGEADRQTVVNWFMNQGLGQGSAKNKAATYLLISSREPNSGGAPTKRAATKNEKSSTDPAKEGKPPKTRTRAQVNPPVPPASKQAPDAMPLNVNVQIHISADASSDQIESIFKSMRQYLYTE